LYYNIIGEEVKKDKLFFYSIEKPRSLTESKIDGGCLLVKSYGFLLEMDFELFFLKEN